MGGPVARTACGGQIARVAARVASKGHPGFKAVQAKIAAREGVSEKAAGAILANSSRNASKGAKQANPRLNRVKG